MITGPSSAPAVPPAPMKPNRRLPCSAVNRSAMNDQNTATANRLNTLTQTKNTRATITSADAQRQAAARTAPDWRRRSDRRSEMKRARGSLRHQRAIERLRDQQRHEGGGEEPRQVTDAAGDAHLVAQRPQHVVAGEEREEIRERPQRRGALLRRCRHRAPHPVADHRHGASESFCLSSAAVTFWP